MQAVGTFFINPTGGPMMTGSQLNNVQTKGLGFGQLLNNMMGQSIRDEGSPIGSQVGNEVLAVGRTGRELMQLMQELEAVINALEEELGSERAAFEAMSPAFEVSQGDTPVTSGEQVMSPIPGGDHQIGVSRELKNTLTEICANIEELLMSLFPQEQPLQGKFNLQVLSQHLAPLADKGGVLNSDKIVEGVRQLTEAFRVFAKDLKSALNEPGTLINLQGDLETLKGTSTELAAALKDFKGQLVELRQVQSKQSPQKDLGDKIFAGTDQREGGFTLQETEKSIGHESVPRTTEQLEEAADKINRAVEKLSELVEKAAGKAETAAESNPGRDNPKQEVSVNHGFVSGQVQEETARTQHPQGYGRVVDNLRVFRSIVESISTGAKLTQTPDNSELTIQLKPESLGTLQMKVTIENGLITAKFTAETQPVKELLEANLNSLRQSLAEQGIKVDQLEVNLGSQKEFQMFDRGTQQWNQPPGRKRYFGTEVSTIPVEDSVQRWYSAGESTIDYTV